MFFSKICMLRRLRDTETHWSFHGGLCGAKNLFILVNRQGGGENGCCSQQVLLRVSNPLSLCCLPDTYTDYDLHHSHLQVSFPLSRSTAYSYIQKNMPLVVGSKTVYSNRVSFSIRRSIGKSFSSTMHSSGDDDKNVESGVNPMEVNRVCKVIEELCGMDCNMEVVLDECSVDLTHDLVAEVLERFYHSRKPAFRFFSWAAQKAGFRHDSRTYNLMMSILSKSRQLETMMWIVEEMEEKGVLTVDTFSIAVRGFAAAKEMKKAFNVFNLMAKHKYNVGVENINHLLDCLGREKLGKEAKMLFMKLEKSFSPNLKTYSVLLNGFCRVKNMLEAGRIWNEMIDKGFAPDVVAHNIMLEGLLRSNKAPDAIKFFTFMKAKGGLSPDAVSYTILIRYLCKHSKMKEAMEYFDEMVVFGCEADIAVYTCLIIGFGNARRMDMVSKLLKEMKEKDCPPDGQTYNALIKLLTNKRKPDDALKIYKKMTKDGVKPTIHTYNMIIKSYFRERAYEMGHVIWDEMKKNGCGPDENSYNVLIGGLVSQGRSIEACEYLDEMRDRGMKTPQLDWDRLVSTLTQLGRLDILEEFAHKMEFYGEHKAQHHALARCANLTKRRVDIENVTDKQRHSDYSLGNVE